MRRGWPSTARALEAPGSAFAQEYAVAAAALGEFLSGRTEVGGLLLASLPEGEFRPWRLVLRELAAGRSIAASRPAP